MCGGSTPASPIKPKAGPSRAGLSPRSSGIRASLFRASASSSPTCRAQGGDPAKLARALIKLESQAELPRRFLAGADAIATAEQKIAILQQQINAYRELSSSLAIDDPADAGS